MTITVEERFGSPRWTDGDSPSAELLFGIFVTEGEDESAVKTAFEAEVPDEFDGMPRRSVRIEQTGQKFWEGEATYSYVAISSSPPEPEAGQSVYSFSTGGGTQRITQSKETIEAYGRPGKTPKDFKGAINVTANGAEGVDIVVPVYQFRETHYFADEDVDDTYKGKLFNLTGKTNETAFGPFEAGEVLFLGSDGTKRGGATGELWEITFSFAASPNAEGIVVGDIDGIEKKGWEYLWVYYEPEEDDDAGGLSLRPASVYVERVYDAGDFGDLGI